MGVVGGTAPTVAGVVASFAASDPRAPAVISGREMVSYGDLDGRARAVASGLRSRGIDRVALVVEDAVSLLALLVGASAAGVEACAYSNALDGAGVAELADAFDHDVIVTDRTLDVGRRAIHPDELLSSAAATGAGNDGPAPLLILTTGTTGRPKGTRHDWRRLVAAAQRWSSPPGSRWLLAYNLNQFAGFQVLLHALTSGAAVVVPERNQPRDALAAMVTHDVTHVSATPTFWRYLLGLAGDGDPLPPLAQITLGGESVPAGLLADLRRRFPGARVSQVYASTEFGSGAAVNDTKNGLPLSVLERGEDADVQMRIVDGELQIRSRVGMLGYYGAEDTGDDWRPTGDLVEIRDERIHFVGRAVEIINVGGVKVHPLTIEELVTQVPGVRFAHARGRANPVAGQIVVLDVVADDGADQDEIEERVRDACESLPAAARPRRIRFVDELDIKENKVRRAGAEA